ncbi:uncharacterized protein LOC131930655 [Physella acuta]|uniref:uncharacterized protein LOC131930655 n=1 Tax=Physella acuta TaxID=109671 RepID=UPI0027DE24F8|nr:uncharacterized protein LOC131930655 [Physella acuta]XP_059143223.1 uncharacterized protein LOC131930655 [Physella acuta]
MYQSLLAYLILATLSYPGVLSEQQCYINKDSYEPNAQVRFAFMSSLRKSEPNTAQSSLCTLISKEMLQNYLAAEWVVEKLNLANNGTGYIRGVKIGFDSFDDCRSPVYASRNALSFVDGWVPTTMKSCTGQPTDSLNIGIVGPSRTSTATRVASLMRDMQVPIVSFAATRAELSNMTEYPTFLRTVPSDVHQMALIASIAKEFYWSYLAIYYVNDEYGTSASNILIKEAEKRGICIAKIVQFNSGSSPSADIGRDFNELIQKAKDESLGLVFIGGKDDAEQFLWNIDKKMGSSKYGLHIILSDASNTDTEIYKNKEIGFGTLAVGMSNLFMQDIYTDITNKITRVKNKQEKHKLIEEYIQQYSSADIFEPNSHSTFLPSTVHAIFAMVEAFRNKFDELCSVEKTVCVKLKSAVEQGSMVQSMFKVKVDYKQMDPSIVPKLFRDNSLTVTFDENGDMEQTNRVPSYTVLQYNGSQYTQVGEYIMDNLSLNTADVKMWTKDRTVSRTIPSSVCKGRCDTCLSRNVIPITYMEGDAYILGVFSAHESTIGDPFQCGAFRSLANDVVAAEGFLFAIKELREKTGIKFGAIAIDDCYSPLRSTTILSDYFSGLLDAEQNIFPFRIPRDKLVGVVACRSSGCTIPTASFFMPLNIPVISYAASSPDLDDKVRFPYFLRTVPSDIFQAQVMLNIVKTMQWQYVGLLYVQNNYGAKAMKAFKELAAKDGSVCVAEEISIGEKVSEDDGKNFFKIWTHLTTMQVKVVVFFGIDVRYRTFLKYLEDEGRNGKFIFIGSEDWGNNKYILQESPKSARGSITLKVEEINLESDSRFGTYLQSKSPSLNDTNIWFPEFWQNIFKCNFKGGYINTFSSECDPSWKLSQDELTSRLNEQRLKQVMNAVYALGYGLSKTTKDICLDSFPCKYLKQDQYMDKVMTYIQEQTRVQGALNYPVFDKYGNGAIGFDVFSIQKSTDEDYIYVKVGTFNSKTTTFQKQDLKFYSETGSTVTTISAACTPTLCAQCTKAKDAVVDVPVASTTSNEYRQPDILLISLVAVLILALIVTVLIGVLCCSRKYKVLEKKLDADQHYDELHHPGNADVRRPPYDVDPYHFENRDLDPYYISSGQNFSKGLPNPTFLNDTPEFVSNLSRSNSASRSKRSIANSQFSNRPLPGSPPGEKQTSEAHDNMGYVESASERGWPTRSDNSQAFQSTRAESIPTRMMSSGQPEVLISPSLDGATNKVYFNKNRNERPSDFVRTQSYSNRSSGRSTLSSAHPEFGPYSAAAALQRRNESMRSNQQALPSVTADQYNDNTGLAEMNMKATAIPQENTPYGSFLKQNSTRPEFNEQVDHTPVHYAVSPNLASTQHASRPQNPDREISYHQADMQHKPQLNEESKYFDKFNLSVEMDGNRSENSFASIPDVIGQTTPNRDLDNPLSLESVDLTSSKESLTDLTETKGKHFENSQRPMRLKHLTALASDV